MLPVASLEPGVNTECRDHVLAVLISPPLVLGRLSLGKAQQTGDEAQNVGP